MLQLIQLFIYSENRTSVALFLVCNFSHFFICILILLYFELDV